MKGLWELLKEFIRVHDIVYNTLSAGNYSFPSLSLRGEFVLQNSFLLSLKKVA
jgi:hypothetical protein